MQYLQWVQSKKNKINHGLKYCSSNKFQVPCKYLHFVFFVIVFGSYGVGWKIIGEVGATK